VVVLYLEPILYSSFISTLQFFVCSDRLQVEVQSSLNDMVLLLQVSMELNLLSDTLMLGNGLLVDVQTQ
jgi:hypothetical protein